MTMATILSTKEDHYQGLIVDPLSLPTESNTPTNTTIEETFGRMLDASLTRWKESSYRGIWLKLQRQDHARLIPVACERGFEFHHAEQEYLMMTKWLPEDVPSTLPPNASHQVGWGVYLQVYNIVSFSKPNSFIVSFYFITTSLSRSDLL